MANVFPICMFGPTTRSASRSPPVLEVPKSTNRGTFKREDFNIEGIVVVDSTSEPTCDIASPHDSVKVRNASKMSKAVESDYPHGVSIANPAPIPAELKIAKVQGFKLATCPA